VAAALGVTVVLSRVAPGHARRGARREAALHAEPTRAVAAAFTLPSLTPVVPAHRVRVAPLPERKGPPENTALIDLGRAIFSDDRLSEPAGTSCASCHDPKRAFSGNHGSDLGVALGSRDGHYARRSTPSVLYLKYVPTFHYFEDDEAAAPSPFGGFFWDGRSDEIADLVRQPLFNPDEMNGGDARRVALKIANAPYAAAFRAAFGAPTDPNFVLAGVSSALEAYLTSDEMAPATSKYDDYVRGSATLTALEQRGLEVFKDQRRGACAGCHWLNETSTNPVRSMFTDYGFDAVGVPRNAELPSNRSPGSFDLGLCRRVNTHTPSDDDKWCGSFRTPSLRNVAVRESFMHNGAFRKLRDVVVFYATRATNPGRFYRAGEKFDDLPVKYRDNVNVSSMPYNRPEGTPPAMTDDEIDAVVAFLETLTDRAYAHTGGERSASAGTGTSQISSNQSAPGTANAIPGGATSAL
jgi:cytochrome c peroxidase